MDGYTKQEILDAGGSQKLVDALERRRIERDTETEAKKAASEALARRRRTLPSGVWMTREGEEIPFEKLEDGHLLRIIEHLRRRAIRDRLGAIYSLAHYRAGGDGASDACEDAMDGFMREDHPDLPEFEGPPKSDDDDRERPWARFVDARWDALMSEARRRKIEPKWTKAEDDSVRMELEGVA